jgi:hypothetical protein
MVGGCLEDEHFNTANGNAEQRTVAHHGQGGLLVWRKADNWTAFTDGYWSWVNGPSGLQRRLNTECFPWEAGCGGGGELDQCVANVDASVRYPQRGGFDQTVFARGTNRAGQPVAGATGAFTVYYSTVTRQFDFPGATNSDGRNQATWSIGGPRGWVRVVVTLRSGGCTASGETGFRGRD